MSSSVSLFPYDASDPQVRGFLHAPPTPPGDVLALTHGAGADCNAPLLISVAEALADAGISVLRFDLPFRRRRPHGPPGPGDAERDREGIVSLVAVLREKGYRRVFLGGHSYGGRQVSMLAAAQPGLVETILLLSYPLHPPRRPQQLRTAHFPNLKTPAVFVHGSRDPFGTLEEMQAAIKLIPGGSTLLPVEGAGHDLRGKKSDSGRFLPDLVRAVLAISSGGTGQ